MEQEPNTENVLYIDEYPELEERLRLQRLARPALRQALHQMHSLVIFERPEPPDGAAWILEAIKGIDKRYKVSYNYV